MSELSEQTNYFPECITINKAPALSNDKLFCMFFFKWNGKEYK